MRRQVAQDDVRERARPEPVSRARGGDVARPGASILLLASGPDNSEMPPAVADLATHFLEVRVISRIPLMRGTEVYGARNLYFLVGWRGTWPDDSTDLLRPR